MANWFNIKDFGTGKNFKRWKAKRRQDKTDKRAAELVGKSGKPSDKFMKSAGPTVEGAQAHAKKVSKGQTISRGASGADLTEGGVFPHYGAKSEIKGDGGVLRKAEKGNKKKAAEFRAAFRAARKAKKKTFVWEGRTYSTAMEKK